MIKQEFRGASGILLPGAITIPKGEEIAISQDWLIFPDAVTGEGKVWTIDGLLEPCIKPDNEVWVDSTVENPFAGPIIYKGKNKYGWQIGEIPEDVINELDYIDRKSVRNIILSNSVTEIPDNAFFECYDLQNIIISNSVQRIGNVAFYHCDSLKTLTIPDTVIEMGGGIFCDCYSLKYIKLPNTLTHLNPYLHTNEEEGWYSDMGFFQRCYSLQNIILPQTLQSIGEYAFAGCSSLTSITIPDSVTSIGDQAFYSCSSLTSVIFSEGLTSIGNWAFYYCQSLTSITIPNSVKQISEYAFYECYGINDLILGNSINYIGQYAFSYCPLQRILSYAEIPPTIEWSTFANVDKYIPLEVPNADLYREAPYWQEFYNIYNINPYQLNISSNNEEWGTVRILEHNTNRSVIEAYYKDGYLFKRWSDGDTNSWRELNITEDTTLVAEFEKIYNCSITDLHIISNTSTQITLGFYIECDQDVETFEYVSAEYSHSGLIPIGINIDNRPGYQELVINDLLPNHLYKVRIAVRNNVGYYTDAQIEFDTYEQVDFEYIDLGLPSGTLWSNKNVGAKYPWDNGAYFSWGNVEGHAVDENGNITDGYSFNSNTYSTTSGGQYTGSTLDAEHDAATVSMGEECRMPTVDETRELVQNTDHYYIDLSGSIVAGPFDYETDRSDKGLNGSALRSICFVKKGEPFDYNNRSNFIEFPFAGMCFNSLWCYEGLDGRVWSSSVTVGLAGGAYDLGFQHDGSIGGNYADIRFYGQSVRGVRNN